VRIVTTIGRIEEARKRRKKARILLKRKEGEKRKEKRREWNRCKKELVVVTHFGLKFGH